MYYYNCHGQNQPNEQDSSQQDISELLPFDPDFQDAEAQQLIANLPQLKDCEFDHNYILHHLEQLEIDPTLCSKCSTASKYFASPEPFVQDLYKRSCYWKRSKGASHDMDIHLYVALDKPYYHMDNLGLKHPSDNLKDRSILKESFNSHREILSSIILQKGHLCKPSKLLMISSTWLLR